MMLFTHAVAGMAYGAIITAIVPSPAAVVALAGGIGGLLPDLDMVAVHRRTLHAPVLQGTAGLVALAAAVAAPGAGTAILAASLGGMALHSISDVLGGGKELRPWERTDDRAVYCHATGSWWHARRMVYDGSPGDLVLLLAAGVAVLVAGPVSVRPIVAAIIVSGAVYAVIRRPLATAIPGRYARFDAIVHELLGLPDTE